MNDRQKNVKLLTTCGAVAAAAAALIVFVVHLDTSDIMHPYMRVRSDFKSIQIALDSYHVDHGEYPAWATEARAANSQFPSGSTAFMLPTFQTDRGPAHTMNTLTTPVAYLTSYFSDPFAPQKRSSFGYYAPSNADSWIIFSAGPDGDYDINATVDYDPTAFLPFPSLSDQTYDPTNGILSNGDVVAKSRE